MGAQSRYEIVIETKADPKELEQEKAALDAVAESAEKANEALAAKTGGNNDYAIQLEREASVRAEMAKSAEQIGEQEQKQVATVERKNALLSQRQAIIEQELEAIAAEAAGDSERAAALEEDIAVRREALTIQKQTTVSEEEAMALAQQRISAERLITAQEEAQAALNAELIAQEEAKLAAAKAQGKVAGDGGKLSATLKNVGVDSGLATTIGIAVLAGTELNRQINEMAKAYDEARITAEQQSAEYAKQVEQWKEMASSAKDMADVAKVTQSVNQGLDSLLEKLRTVKGEGSGGFFQSLTDGAKGWLNILTDANREMLVNTGQITKAEAEALALQQHVKTSTEDTQNAISDQLATAAKAGQVYENLAQKQADWFKALESKPVSEQIALLIEKERDLIIAQEGVNRSSAEGQKRWAAYQKQIDDVVKAEGRAIEEQNKNVETLQRLDEQIAKLTADLPRLRADLDDMKKSGNEFVKLTTESIGGVKSDGFFRKSDTVTDAGGHVVPVAGSQPVPVNDPALVAFQQAVQKLTETTQRLADDQAKKQTVQAETTGAAHPSHGQPGLSDQDLSLRNEGGEAQLDDFERTLRDRGTADKLQNAGESLGSDVAPKLDDSGTNLQTAGEKLSEASDSLASVATDSLAPAAEALSSVPQHFDAILESLAPLPKTIADSAAPIPAQITALGDTVAASNAAIASAVVAADAKLQQQINALTAQIDGLWNSIG